MYGWIFKAGKCYLESSAIWRKFFSCYFQISSVESSLAVSDAQCSYQLGNTEAFWTNLEQHNVIQ